MIIRGVQIMGILFALTMIYLTHLYYKRKDYPRSDFLIWTIIWLTYTIMVVFPSSTSDILDTMGVTTSFNLLVITANMLAFALLFYQHDEIRRNQKKLDKLIRQLTLEKQNKKQ